MTQHQIFETGNAPMIVIEKCHGDLKVRAWEREELEVRAGGGDLNITQNENEFRCKIFGDGVVHVPPHAHLQIQEANGDAKLSGVQGEIAIDSVGGTCRVRECGPVSLSNVGGDFSVMTIKGPCTVNNVGGSLRVRHIAGSVDSNNVGGDALCAEIQGSLRLGHAGGDVKLHQIEGQVHLDRAGGNISIANVKGNVVAHAGGDLTVKEVAGNINAESNGNSLVWLWLDQPQQCNIQARGDLTCRLPAEVSAAFNLHSGGRTTIKHLNTHDVANGGDTQFVLGEGESSLNLSAGGNLHLIGGQPPEQEDSFAFDFEFGQDFADQIAAQVETHMGQLTQQLDEKLANLGDSDEIAARVHERVQHAIHKAEEKIARAMQYAERRIHAAERKAERRERGGRHAAQRWSRTPLPPRPPVPPRAPKAHKQPGPASNPASEEERMMILRMVEQGKISIEQAETLLNALEE